MAALILAQAAHTFATRAEQTIAAATIILVATTTISNAAYTYAKGSRFQASGVVITAVTCIFAAGSIVIVINAALAVRAEHTIAAAAIILGANATFFNAAYTHVRASRFHAFGVVIAAVSCTFAAGSIVIVINTALQNFIFGVTKFLAHRTGAALIIGNYLLVAHPVQACALKITVLIIELKGDKTS
jgi:hypothetical protein